MPSNKDFAQVHSKLLECKSLADDVAVCDARVMIDIRDEADTSARIQAAQEILAEGSHNDPEQLLAMVHYWESVSDPIGFETHSIRELSESIADLTSSVEAVGEMLKPLASDVRIAGLQTGHAVSHAFSAVQMFTGAMNAKLNRLHGLLDRGRPIGEIWIAMQNLGAIPPVAWVDGNDLSAQFDLATDRITNHESVSPKTVEPLSPAKDGLVKIKDVARFAHLGESSLTPYIAKWGKPVIEKSGRRAAKFSLSAIRETLRTQFPNADQRDWEALEASAESA